MKNFELITPLKRSNVFHRFCKKCGKIKSIPHEHMWERINSITQWNHSVIGYVQECKICGKLNNFRHTD